MIKPLFRRSRTLAACSIPSSISNRLRRTEHVDMASLRVLVVGLCFLVCAAQEAEKRGVTHVVNCTDDMANFCERGGKVKYLRFNVAYW